MARKKPSEWPRAPDAFHPARQTDFRFESLQAARREDHRRAAGFQRYLVDDAALTKVALSLRKLGRHPRCLASQRYSRRRRIAFNSNLHRLVASRKKPIWLGTLLPRGWLVPADELATIEPQRLMAQLRAVLFRAGITKVAGWAYFVLDVEYVEHLDALWFHIHCLATRKVARRLRGLRQRRKFKWPKDCDGAPKRPVQVKKVARCDEGRVVNYLLKSFFGMRVYEQRADGSFVRTRRRTSILEPRRSELTAWLSRWGIDDFVLPMNVYFGSDRLQVSRRRHR